MRFIVARAARITGGLLENMVRSALNAQHIPEPDCIVCYGAGYGGNKPALNAKCSDLSKLEQTKKLAVALKDNALDVVINPPPYKGTLPKVLIARKTQHAKGKDILICKTQKQLDHAKELGRTYFTPLVESDTEYRAWVYRKRILSVYEKRLTEPNKNKKFGRNRANGYTFHALAAENIPESVRRVAVAAVAALGLDFGAVDILGKWDDDTHTDVHATVLEVNSAPGVQNEHRSAIVRLCNRIVRWCANGCPARN
jgi:hypothetical protein